MRTYEKLLSMGFNDKLAFDAASKYPLSVDDATGYIVSIQKQQETQKNWFSVHEKINWMTL